MLDPRSSIVDLRSLLMAVSACLFLFPAPAFAHDLKAEARLAPFWLIEVESWFDSGEVPRQARVEVYRPDGSLVTAGRLDRHGFFAFLYQEPAPLRIVVSAGAGHRAEAAIGADELRKNAAAIAALCLTPPPSLLPAPLLAPMPPREAATNDPAWPSHQHDTGLPIGNLLLGVLILLLIAGVAAWFASLRRAAHPHTEMERRRD